VARLAAERGPGPGVKIKLGTMRGEFTVPADFDAPLPDDVLAGFNGGWKAGMVELSVVSEVAARVANLQRLHGDPFDRLLVVQAQAAEAVLLTTDRALAPYGDHVRIV